MKDNLNYLKSISVYRVQIYGENVYTDKSELMKNIFIDEFNYKQDPKIWTLMGYVCYYLLGYKSKMDNYYKIEIFVVNRLILVHQKLSV